ncbi:MAG: hypothetical protein ACKVYV_02535, partial [Limisphaerales bacterium]
LDRERPFRVRLPAGRRVPASTHSTEHIMSNCITHPDHTHQHGPGGGRVKGAGEQERQHEQMAATVHGGISCKSFA